jgi:hypothetical protein
MVAEAGLLGNYSLQKLFPKTGGNVSRCCMALQIVLYFALKNSLQLWMLQAPHLNLGGSCSYFC